MSVDADVLVYRIDAADTITWVSDNWSAFALANAWAGRVPPDAVVGRSLWEFIEGQETIQIYRALLQRVRDGRRVRKIPFRCDSPGAKRFCELEMAADPAGDVEITSRTLRTEPRPRIPLLDSATERGPGLIMICSTCKKVNLSGDRWSELDQAVEELDIFDNARMPMLSHGLCPSCYQTFMDELEG